MSMRNLAILIGVPVVLWGAALYPGWLMSGDDVFLQSGVALALCLTPAIATYLGIQRFAKSADARTLATLAASGIRIAVCMGGGMALHLTMGTTFPAAFLYWLLAFYLVILGLEVGLLTRPAHET